MCEGAQGYYLDVDWGNYPYVTSSTTLPYGACSLGFPPQKIRHIWGISKLYDTRSGVDPLFPESLLKDEELAKLGDLGGEIGVTTGRKRKCNWLNVDLMLEAAKKTGTTHLVINKCDIIKKLKIFKCFTSGELKQFDSYNNLTEHITDSISKADCLVKHIYFSNSPETL